MRITDFSNAAMRQDFTKINKVCLVDADRFKHIAFHRMEKIANQEFGFDEPTFETLKQIIKAESVGQCDDLEMTIKDPIVYCFSGKSSNTFRYHLAISKEYKGNRTSDKLTIEEFKQKIDLMNHAMECIMREKACLLFEDLEADDLLSALQDEDTYIVSVDKDLRQVPGLHYDLDQKKIITIESEDALITLAKQMLTGDSTDNIGGLEGIGPKKAEKILENVKPKNALNVVYRHYKMKYGIIKGTDSFTEAWNLVKLRSNHGGYFKEKYKQAFMLVDEIKKNVLHLNPKV